MKKHYDIIGDIHGHSQELELLLAKLGYVETDGTFQHPAGRRIIFLGDYVDRGPNIRHVLQIVRQMTDSGKALAILGNHEVNAMRYHSMDEDGRPLRSHTDKNKHQHRETLSQLVHAFPDEWPEWLTWFSELPLWLDLGDLRAVHACWDSRAIEQLRETPPLRGDALARFSRQGTEVYDAISQLLNGPEAQLAQGETMDSGGCLRSEIRVRWWETKLSTKAREAVFPSNPKTPDVEINPPSLKGYAGDEPPVFFGHYAASVEEAILAPNVACLDHGCGKGGFLTAYRWDGEQYLDPQKMVMIPTSSQ